MPNKIVGYTGCSTFEKKLILQLPKFENKRGISYYTHYEKFFNRQEKYGIIIDSFCANYMTNKVIHAYRSNDNMESLKKFTEIFGSQTPRYSSSFASGNMMNINGVTSEFIDNAINKMKVSSLATTYKKDPDNIPKVLHSIWLTNKNNPKEIKNEDIKNIFNSKDFFQESDPNWKYVVWTNDKNIIQSSTQKLEDNSIEVHSIYEIKEQIQLFDLVANLIEHQKFGMASDILRYSILFSQGGVYLDLNFKPKNNLEKYINKYDFLTQFTQNNFFVSKAYHIILEKTLSHMHNFFNTKKLDDLSNDQTMIYTHTPFVLLILQNSNIEGNVDFYHTYYADFYLPNEGFLGEDNFSSENTWMEL